MRVSLFIPTYRDIRALELILDALKIQTHRDFEVIVAEDDSSVEVKEFLKNYSADFSIKHFSHENQGNRKAVILNKALSKTEGKYLIFIDGDTIPYTTFIASHVALSASKTVLCGRRVNLGEAVSTKLRKKELSAFELEKHFLFKMRYLLKAKTRHYEQGIYLKPNGLLQKIVGKFNKNVHILGSNFSLFKEDMFAINGFDEDIVGGSKDDVDLEWRLVDNGCTLKSAKYCANLFHLHHSRASRVEDERYAKEQMHKNRQEKKFICSNGIEKL